jgi:hypothetical protein
LSCHFVVQQQEEISQQVEIPQQVVQQQEEISQQVVQQQNETQQLARISPNAFH